MPDLTFRCVRSGMLLFMGLWLAAPFTAAQEGDFLSLQRRLTEIFEANQAAVVRVKAAVEEEEDEGEPAVALRVGTGFFISREGHVLTNASVAYGATRIWIELDGISYAADSLGDDPRTNLSLLKLMTPPSDLTYISVRTGTDAPPVGSLTVVISCPLEFDPSPALGLVAGRESSFADRVFPVTYVRVNVPAHPGEGGAPVLDLNGRLIGMLVASLPEVRSSYFLPTRAIVRVRDDLLFSGNVETGWIGIELDTEISRADGRHMVIENITPGGPADEAGLKAGDKLLRMGEFDITRPDDVRNAHFYHRVGEFVEMRVRRGKEVLNIPVKLGRRPEEEDPEPDYPVSPVGDDSLVPQKDP